MSRKWQQWIQDRDVNVWVYLDPTRRTAGQMLLEAILDASTASSATVVTTVSSVTSIIPILMASYRRRWGG